MREFSHEINLSGTPSENLPYFTPKGEEAWVPGWAPRYHWPEDGSTRKGMVFETGTGPDHTIWTCLTFNQKHHHARYLRTTPESRVAFVDVSCRPDRRGTTVRVSYRYVALTAAGQAEIDAMNDAGFAAEIDGWRDLVDAHKRSAKHPPEH